MEYICCAGCIIAPIIWLITLFAPKRSKEIPSVVMTTIQNNLSESEEIIEIVRYRGGYDHYLVLTHRRILQFQVSEQGVLLSMSDVAIRNITQISKETNKDLPVLKVTTIDGKMQLSWDCTPKEKMLRLMEQLTILLDRQASQKEMVGTSAELEKIAELVDRGILDKEDFERAKGLMLGKPISKVEEATRMLESLASLYKQGVLSESEFNMKKWDILSRS